MSQFFHNYDEWVDACIERGWTIEKCRCADETCRPNCIKERTVAIDRHGRIASIFKHLTGYGVLYDQVLY